jgi:hypothetical protein
VARCGNGKIDQGETCATCTDAYCKAGELCEGGTCQAAAPASPAPTAAGSNEAPKVEPPAAAPTAAAPPAPAPAPKPVAPPKPKRPEVSSGSCSANGSSVACTVQLKATTKMPGKLEVCTQFTKNSAPETAWDCNGMMATSIRGSFSRGRPRDSQASAGVWKILLRVKWDGSQIFLQSFGI